MAGTEEVYRTTLNIPHPYNDGLAERWIASHALAYFEGRGLTLAVTLKEDRILVGAVGLTASPANHRAELGYWIGPDYWGNGFCTEASRALVAYGLGTLRYHKITCRHMTTNPASGRVMQKIGMVLEGSLADEICKDGRFYSLDVYGLVSPEEGSGEGS